MARQSNYRKLTKQWTRIQPVTVAMTADAIAVGGGRDFTEAQTVLRVVGEYDIQATAAPVQFDAAHITVALGIFSTDAFDLGQTAMPDPANEADYPWLYWASHLLRFGAAAIQDADGAGFVRRTLDIRSMRKVKPRETLGWVFQYENGGGDPPINVGNERCRVLVGIH